MFTSWMVGFLLLMAALVWLAVVIGVPQPVLGLVVLVLVVLVVGGLLASFWHARQLRRGTAAQDRRG